MMTSSKVVGYTYIDLDNFTFKVGGCTDTAKLNL